jgi:cytidylate kinase
MDKERRKIIIAIDGPAGSGKSTLAARLARKYGYVNIETGAMYRALALKVCMHWPASRALNSSRIRKGTVFSWMEST